MRICGLTIGLAALAMLAACGSEPPPEPLGEAEPVAVEQELPVIGPERRILAFGDSLFAGYNLAEGEGYPEKLEVVLRTRGINARIIDAGVSGNTTAAGLERITFVLDAEAAPPELAIVELGGNDLLRGIEPAATRDNLAAILDVLEARGIPVLLMGMRAPPNLGAQFQQQFDGIYPALAQQYEAALVPFFMQAIFDRPDLIQQDRIHPTAEGVVALVEATADAVVAALPEPSGEAPTGADSPA